MQHLSFRSTLMWALVGFLAVGTFSACNGDDEPEVDPGQFVDSCGFQTGRLSVEVRRNGINGQLVQAEVFVYVSYEDYVNQLSLSRFFTNPNGFLDLGCFNLGNYYVEAVRVENGRTYAGVKPVQAQDDRDFLVTVPIFEQP